MDQTFNQDFKRPMLNNFPVTSPKRKRIQNGIESWYPYYAGFSMDFVASVLASEKTNNSDACIVDPWNGSGTTTSFAYENGFTAFGYDLNPVMVIAARACLLSSTEKSSIVPLSIEIVERAKEIDEQIHLNEPLNTWFKLAGSVNFRKLECSIQKILVHESKFQLLAGNSAAENISSLAAFYYVAIFRTLREILNPFKTSNPTWIKIPENKNKLCPSLATISKIFLDEVKNMITQFPDKRENKGNGVHVGIGSSCRSSLANSIADFIVTSPPYCTRIDYAVATMPELTLLGYSPIDSLDDLRRQLIGTSTVPYTTPDINEMWGGRCVKLLDDIFNHKSKASQTYYYKNHIQYFDSIYTSYSEIARILKTNGKCVLVVQDSYYKDIHNDLPNITIEMCESLGLLFERREDFTPGNNMAGINPNVRKYRNYAHATESVLFFTK